MQKPTIVQPASAAPDRVPGPKQPLKKTKKRVVRDSFKMPRPDFELIAALKKRADGLNHRAKKNELLRAGLISLQRLSDANLTKVLDSLTPLKGKSTRAQ